MTTSGVWFSCFCLLFLHVHGRTTCDDGWISFQGQCYYFGHDTVHFTEAEHYCRQHNSHLIEVYSNLENNFIKERLGRLKAPTPNCYWIGMTDELIEGTWQWHSSHANVNFTDWGSGQPGQDGEQDCAEFFGVPSAQFHWHDTECTTSCVPVCKRW